MGGGSFRVIHGGLDDCQAQDGARVDVVAIVVLVRGGGNVMMMMMMLMLLRLEGLHHLDLVVQARLLERRAHGAALLEVQVHARPEHHGVHVQRPSPGRGCGSPAEGGGDHVGDGLPVAVGVLQDLVGVEREVDASVSRPVWLHWWW